SGDDEGYAGIEFDHDWVVLWWRGRVSDSLNAVIEEARAIAKVDVRAAPHTRREIMAAAGQLIDFIEANPNSGYVSVSYPEDGTRVRLGVAPNAALAAPALPSLDVPVELVPGLSFEKASRNHDTPPFSGGAAISASGFCTSGFGVYRCDGDNTTEFVITAAHC